MPTSTVATVPRSDRAYFRLRRLYRRHVAPRIALGWLTKQRLKLLWFGWGYIYLFRTPALSFVDALALLVRFVKVDWSVPHGHEHRDLSLTIRALGARRARPGEVMIETGCWQGGSTAKWSLACRRLGYNLHVFDSFQGVEARTSVEGRYDYTGEYCAAFETVRDHVARFGDLSVCTFHKGWFCDTMQPGTVPGPVRLVYIDCDLVKGTREVLSGVLPVLSNDGVIVSEDCQIPVVAAFLANPATWESLGVRVRSQRYTRHIAMFEPY